MSQCLPQTRHIHCLNLTSDMMFTQEMSVMVCITTRQTLRLCLAFTPKSIHLPQEECSRIKLDASIHTQTRCHSFQWPQLPVSTVTGWRCLQEVPAAGEGELRATVENTQLQRPLTSEAKYWKWTPDLNSYSPVMVPHTAGCGFFTGAKCPTEKSWNIVFLGPFSFFSFTHSSFPESPSLGCTH